MIPENEEAGVLGSNYTRPVKSMIIEHPRIANADRQASRYLLCS